MSRPSDKPREPAKEHPGRIGERQKTIDSRWFKWFFLTGNRFVIAGGLLVGIFVATSAVAVLDSKPLQQPSALFYVFGGLIGGNLTLITVVISINQLVLSRELGTPGQIEQQLQHMREYREDVAEATDRQVLPYLPPDFMAVLLEETRKEVQTLEETIGQTDGQVETELTALVTVLTDHIDEVAGLLDKENVRPFSALSTTLNANYAAYVHDAKRIETIHDSVLPAAATEQLTAIKDRLRDLDVAREYFKTLFMQEELAYLSRVLFYVGIPAELSAILVLYLFAITPAGSPPGVGTPFLVPLAVTIGLAPFAVLFAFVVRIGVVTQHTAPIVPFGMPSGEP